METLRRFRTHEFVILEWSVKRGWLVLEWRPKAAGRTFSFGRLIQTALLTALILGAYGVLT